MEPLRRAAKVAVFGNRNEIADVAQFHPLRRHLSDAKSSAAGNDADKAPYFAELSITG